MDDEPNKSIAILTGERAQTDDPRVCDLTDGIIEVQRREIGKMKTLMLRHRRKQIGAAAAVLLMTLASSENREIRPNAFERDVPPLNGSRGPPTTRPLTKASSVQHTQKSFSTF